MTKVCLAFLACFAALLFAACGGGGGSSPIIPPLPVAVIADVVPDKATPGSQVVIIGSNLAGTFSVVFPGGVAAKIEATSDTQVNVTVPVGAGTGFIRITTPAGATVAGKSFTTTSASPSVNVSSFSPASGSAGSVVTVFGANLDGAASASIGGVPAPIQIARSYFLQVIVPGGVSGGLIELATGSGPVVSSQAFTVVAPPPGPVGPALHAFLPASGTPGATVTLFGANFTGDPSVTMGGVQAKVLTSTDTLMDVVVPQGAGIGPIVVTTQAGSVTGSPDFTVIAPGPKPFLLDFLPATGSPGTKVTLYGWFPGATAVSFAGSDPQPILAASDYSLDVKVPANAQTGVLTVTTPSGPVSSSKGFTVAASPVPVISRFTPLSGAPGTVVTLLGSGFTGASSVSFGSIQGTIKAMKSFYIDVAVPPGAATGVITVTTPEGQGSSTQPFTVTAAGSGPSISEFLPKSGPPGAPVTLFGDKLQNVNAVAFGTASGQVKDHLGTGYMIDTAVPANAAPGAVPIRITGPDGSADSAETFLVTAPAGGPVIAGVAPLEGSPGATVRLTGAGFTAIQSASFGGGVAATILPGATDARLDLSVPAGASDGVITLRTLAGSASSPQTFRVRAAAPVAPSLYLSYPVAGRPNTDVYLGGSNLKGVTEVRFGGKPARAPLRIVDDLLIGAVVPSDAQSGPITVVSPAGQVTSTFIFTVDPTPGPSPVLNQVEPTRGTQGSKVTLAGSALAGASTVTFGNVPAAFEIQFYGLIKATVPAGLQAGPVDITVTTPWNSQSTLAGEFTYLTAGAGAPVIDSFDPESGRPSTLISVLGQNLATVNRASIGGRDCSGSIFIWSDKLLVLEAPGAPVSGPITLTSPNGTASSGTPFNLTAAPPTITDFFPMGGAEGTPVIIQGTFLDNVTSVTFGSTPATTITEASAESLKVLVPLGATSGPITVTNAGGSIATTLSFNVTSALGSLGVRIATMYITQGTQRRVGSVPLVADRDGYLRVFVLANEAAAGQPKVRVTLKDGAGTAVLTEIISAPGTQVPTTIDEHDLTQSWNLRIPGNLIQKDSTLLAELLPGPGFPAPDPMNRTFPPNNTPMPLDVRAVPPLGITLFPVVSGGRTGKVTDDGRTLASWTERIAKTYPVSAIDIQVGAPFTTTTVLGASRFGPYVDVRDQLELKRLADDPANLRYYSGIFSLPPGGPLLGLGQFAKKGDNKNRSSLVADVTGRVDGDNYPEILAHEIGHNLGRYHAPCGGAAGPDLEYPYKGGQIGAPGMDVAGARTIDPQATTDMMGYCTPRWISDYTYKAILDFRSGDPGPAPLAASASGPGLLVRGTLRDGVLALQPAFEVAGCGDLPEPGAYTLQCLDAAGRVLQSVAFEPMAIEDLPDGVDYRSFAFVIPMTPAMRDGLAGLKVSGEGRQALLGSSFRALAMREPVAVAWHPGEVHVGWDSGVHGQIMVKDPRTGLVIAMGEGGSLDLATDATELELVLSDGLRTQRRLVRVQP